MEIDNVYELFTQVTHDRELEEHGHLILNAHQVIPRYYLFGKKDRRALILNYSTGSGKSITGLFTILDKLQMRKLDSNIPIARPYVVGEWVTQQQFKIDMARPSFQLITEEASQILLDDDADIKSKEKVQRLIGRLANFTGYQMLFNNLFGDNAEQDVEKLINLWNTGKLKPKEYTIESLRDNVIVVDEMQRLYSQDGLNTYGFTLSYLSRRAAELNLKIVYMTGTCFNTSISELSSILNLVTDRPTFYTPEEICYQKRVLDDELLWVFDERKLADVSAELNSRYIYYGREIVSKTSKTDYDGYAYREGVTRSIVRVNSSDYPMEVILGNTSIDSKLNIMQLQAQGYQLEALRAITNDTDDDEGFISPYDVALPPRSEWAKEGIDRDSNGVFGGRFLKKENIGRFSCIGSFIIDFCIENAKHNEKTVLYHSKINNFGLLQYGRILEVNGLVRRGLDPFPWAICKSCGKEYSTHSNDGTSSCHFQPIYFEFLHGGQTLKERDTIVKYTFNAPNNLYGDLCSVLLISGVADTGVSLLATNNMALLSRISNMSKLQQIMARIVRFKGHLALPPERRVAKFYILGATPAISDRSPIYKYYKLRSMSQEEIDDFISKLRPDTIGHLLINDPSKLKLDKEERTNTSALLFDEGKRILEGVGKLIRPGTFGWWRLSEFIRRLKSDEFAISYLKLSIFPDTFVRRFIADDKRLELFSFREVNSNEPFQCVRLISDRLLKPARNPNQALYFVQIKHDFQEVIARYKDEFEASSVVTHKQPLYERILNMLTAFNDYSALSDWKPFWTYLLEIGNQWYKDDATNFIENHAKQSREADGFYWNDRIVTRSLEVRRIEHSRFDPSWNDNTNTIIEVKTIHGLHIGVYTKKEERRIVDLRSRARSSDCFLTRNQRLVEYYKVNVINGYQTCKDILIRACTEQLLNPAKRFIITPFEFAVL